MYAWPGLKNNRKYVDEHVATPTAFVSAEQVALNVPLNATVTVTLMPDTGALLAVFVTDVLNVYLCAWFADAVELVCVSSNRFALVTVNGPFAYLIW